MASRSLPIIPAKVFCFATTVPTVLKSCFDAIVLVAVMIGLLNVLAAVKMGFLFWIELVVGNGTCCLNLSSWIKVIDFCCSNCLLTLTPKGLLIDSLFFWRMILFSMSVVQS